MKRKVLTSVGVFLFAAGAQAGIVSFIPVVPGSDVVHIDDLPAQVSYDVHIKPETFGPRIDAFNVIIGSNDVAFSYQDWEYAPGFECQSLFCDLSFGLYEYDFFVGGFFLNRDASGPLGVLFGTLTVTYPPLGIQSMPGEYLFGVDAHFDGGASSIARSLESELLFGQGVLHVIPEPATPWLLAIGAGAIAMKRYRRRRAI